MSFSLTEGLEQFSQLQQQVESLSKQKSSLGQQTQAEELSSKIFLLRERIGGLIALEQESLQENLLIPLLKDSSNEIETEMAVALSKQDEYKRLQVRVETQYLDVCDKLQTILSRKVDFMASSFFSGLRTYALPVIGLGVGGVMVKMAYDAVTAFVRDHSMELACAAGGVVVAASAIYCYATAPVTPYVRVVNERDCPEFLQSIGPVYTVHKDRQDLRRVLAIQLAVAVQQGSGDHLLPIIPNAQLRKEATRVFQEITQLSLETVLQSEQFMQVLYAVVLQMTPAQYSDEEAMRYLMKTLAREMGYQVVSLDSSRIEIAGQEFGGTVPFLRRGIVKVDGNYYSVDSQYFAPLMDARKTSVPVASRMPGMLYASTGTNPYE